MKTNYLFNTLQLFLQITCCCIVVFFSANFSSAQQNQDAHDITIVLPNTSSIQLNGSDIQLKAETPANAGDKLDFVHAEDNNLWLNYSAVTEEAKEIYVSIVDGDLPNGVALKVDASFTEEGGQGNIGQSQGAVTLSNQNQRIIQGITTCYTGEGLNNGRQLAYSLVATKNYGDIKAVSNKTITVCYTITD